MMNKIPFWETVQKSYGIVFKDMSPFFRAASPLILLNFIYVILGYKLFPEDMSVIMGVEPQNVDPEGSFLFGLFGIRNHAFAVFLLVYILFMTAFYAKALMNMLRVTLLLDLRHSLSDIFSFSSSDYAAVRIIFLIFGSFASALAVYMSAALGVYYLSHTLPGAVSMGLSIFVVVAIVAVLALISIFALRILFFFPVLIENPDTSLNEARDIIRGHALRVFGIWFVCAVSMGVATEVIESLWRLFAPDNLLMRVMTDTFRLCVFDTLVLAVTTTALACAYRFVRDPLKTSNESEQQE